MSKTHHQEHAANSGSQEARAMILSGRGKKQVFADRRNKRPKDARKMRERMQDELTE
jgi:hypothetical protein